MLRSPFLALSLALALVPALATAQERRPSHCIAIAESAPGLAYLHKAAVYEAVPEFSVRLRYLTHSMFLIETASGDSAVTDYTGFIGTTDFVPDVATMNNAHSTHWTSAPDPRIPHLLEGWQDETGPRDHHVEVGGMLVRNVHTDVRGGFGGMARVNGNSIFIFEAEGLCVGHLGHLHHYPDPAQLAAIGRLDVVMAAVDGGLTLDLPTMIQLMKRLKSSVVIPMHWFSGSSLEVFLAGMADEFDIEIQGGSTFEVSLRTLPDRPTVVVLSPEYLID